MRTSERISRRGRRTAVVAFAIALAGQGLTPGLRVSSAQTETRPGASSGQNAAAEPQTTGASPAPSGKQAESQASPSGAREFASADELLTALQTAGQEIRTLGADIRYTKKFAAIEGSESQVRLGRLWFRSVDAGGSPGAPAGASESGASGAVGAPAKATRVFQVDFSTLIVDDRQRDEAQSFVFDGEWLVERQHAQKLQFKRRVVPPGQKMDPLAIGEGPFPLPIGQSREKILERFDAELLAPTDGWPGAAENPPVPPPEWLLNTYQLKLKPKVGTDEARKFESVRLWYVKGTLLPRLALTDEGDGAFSEVLLTNVRVNTELEKGIFEITLPAGWDEKVSEYEDRKGS